MLQKRDQVYIAVMTSLTVDAVRGENMGYRLQMFKQRADSHAITFVPSLCLVTPLMSIVAFHNLSLARSLDWQKSCETTQSVGLFFKVFLHASYSPGLRPSSKMEMDVSCHFARGSLITGNHRRTVRFQGHCVTLLSRVCACVHASVRVCVCLHCLFDFLYLFFLSLYFCLLAYEAFCSPIHSK